MKKNTLILYIVFALLLCLFLGLRMCDNAKMPEPSPQPTAAVATLPPTPEPTPQTEFVLSFAGDTTLGSLVEWQGSTAGDFQSTVGQDYGYPLKNVKSVFAADDFTMVNLEGTLTKSSSAVSKKYRFKGDPAYAKILSEGGVEAVALSNNHAGDLKDTGRADTKAAVEAEGIRWADYDTPLIYQLPNGPRLGIVNYNTVEDERGESVWRADIERNIRYCREQQCDFIIGFMHWGSVEYLEQAEKWAYQLGHDMVDWGCNLIVGGHAHILQPMETYNGVPIFYSMGNFCYGGHLNPKDKDSVIVSVTLKWENGTAALQSVKPLPCSVSSSSARNDYCPTLYEEGSEGYQRVLKKLKWGE